MNLYSSNQLYGTIGYNSSIKALEIQATNKEVYSDFVRSFLISVSDDDNDAAVRLHIEKNGTSESRIIATRNYIDSKIIDAINSSY